MTSSDKISFFTITAIFLFFILIFFSIFDGQKQTRQQFMNHVSLVLKCRQSNIEKADQICGPVPQWATYTRRD